MALGALNGWLELVFWPPNGGKDVVVPIAFEDARTFPACCPKLKPFEGCCMLEELFVFAVPHDGAGKLCDKGEACDVSGRA